MTLESFFLIGEQSARFVNPGGGKRVLNGLTVESPTWYPFMASLQIFGLVLNAEI